MKRVLSSLLLAALAGCAILPRDLPPRPRLKTPEAAATMTVLSAEIGPARAQANAAGHWWQAFGSAELDHLIEIALENHPDLAAAQARLRLAEQAEHLARLDTQVQYSTDATLYRERYSRNGLFPPPIGGSFYTQTDVDQNLSYNLDWWGKNRDLVRAAGNETEAARDEETAVRLDVAAAVADACADHVVAAERGRDLRAARHRPAALDELGVGTGDRVAVVADNGPAWLEVDLAVQATGAWSIGVYPSLAERELVAALVPAQVRVAFCGDQEQVDTLLECGEELASLELIVVFDTKGLHTPEYADAPIRFLDELRARGHELAEERRQASSRISSSIRLSLTGGDVGCTT